MRIIDTVLVTGVAGFIGGSLARSLMGSGHRVVGIDSITDYYSRELKTANVADLVDRGLEFVEGDLNDHDLDRLLDRGIDTVYHLAGQPGVRKSWGHDFRVYTAQNVDATQRLLEACNRRTGLRRFVYASSSSIYGQAEMYPTRETTVPAPFSPYGVTKLAGEHLVGLYRANDGLPGTSFRFFTVYGPGQRPDMAFTRFLTAARNGDPISIYGDGEQVRDFTYVDDIVDALIRAGAHTGELPPVMNLAGGSSVSVNETLQIIRQLNGGELNVEYLPSVKGDVRRTGGDSTLARENLGWTPRVTIEEGLARQFRWIASR